MRQIKFRAWDRGNPYDEDSKPRMIQDVQDLYDGSISELGGYGSFGQLLNEERFAIQQFTGLLDCKGKDIYEGDILAYCNDKSPRNGKVKGHVVFNNARFRLKRFREEESHLDTLSVPSYTRSHEVIGNIYEHKELLK